MVIEYRNTGNVDVTAPLMQVQAQNANLRFDAQSDYVGGSVWLLGINNAGPAGTLPPGAAGSVQLLFEPGTAASCTFSVLLPPSTNTPADWASLKDSLRPEDVLPEAWDAIYANFVARLGPTMGQCQSALAQDATYLGQLGSYVTDVRTLASFELFHAGQEGAISQRYNLGTFGRGQVDPTNIVAVTNTAGDVRIRVSQTFMRLFKLQADGSYLALPGDYGVLTLAKGHYQISESDGTILAFRPDNTLDYIEDPNLNRLTCNYTSGRLASWTDSWGDSVLLTYNAQGRVVSLTDPVGRNTTFAYDALGEHLTSIVAPDGTTNSYTYVTGQGAAREHALASVTAADGTRLNLEYDDLGALTQLSQAGGQATLTIDSDSPGTVTVTDANGASVKFLYDHLGQLRQLIDPFGNLTRLDYDANHNLTRAALPGGLSSSFNYDPRGNLIAGIDALGSRLDATYDPTLNVPLSLRTPGGQQTQFTYDGRGNPLSMIYPDGRTEQATYDARGAITNAVDGRAIGIQYVYDDKGLLTKKQYADGSRVQFSYDAHRNLTNISQINGATNRATVMAYDAADRLIKVTDRFNRSLAFNYDGAGRRTRMLAGDGFAVNYAYDAQGRLSQVTDAAGNTNVTYNYDAGGRLANKQLGNGALATYQYDAANQIVRLVNQAPDGSILSRFDYAYDKLGRRTRLVTLEGTNDYAYDAIGQLAAVTLPGGRTIDYTYDAEGNRSLVSDNGAATAYLPNNLDQYTMVGSAACQYDADGNLISKTDGGQTWTYAYR